MSVPQSNSTQITPMPTAVADRTRRTDEAPLMALSIGNVTSDSSSSGAIPCPSARMVTVGAVRSGNTSIGMPRAVQTPAPSSRADITITIQWWSIDQLMSRFMRFPRRVRGTIVTPAAPGPHTWGGSCERACEASASRPA